MASLEFHIGDGRLDRLPPVCIKTGRPTSESVRVAGFASPSWVGPMVLFGFLAWLVARGGASRRYEIEVPLSVSAWQHYRRSRRAGQVAIVVGLALSAIAVAIGTEGPQPFMLVGIAVIGALGLLLNEWINWFGIRLSRDQGYLLTRVHPDFVDAVTRSRS